ncbi:MAG: hypothetical protein HYR63_00375 [Proteobacteria bacterium]|nr:hypothetical protein [Pseudomonadota bacterium]
MPDRVRGTHPAGGAPHPASLAGAGAEPSRSESRAVRKLGSSLGRAIPAQALGDEAMRAMAGAAWHKPGPDVAVWVCIRLGDVLDDFDRQAVRNVADRLYGKRPRAPDGAP